MTPRAGEVLAVHVVGTPKPQGSKRGFVVPGKGGGRPRAVVVDANKRPLRDWRSDVIDRVQTAMATAGGVWPVLGPVAVRIAFAVPRPASVRRPWPSVKPDIDKLARAVLDAMTDAGLWKDDAQVVDLHPTKQYPGPGTGQTVPGALITVWRVSEPASGTPSLLGLDI